MKNNDYLAFADAWIATCNVLGFIPYILATSFSLFFTFT